MKSRITCAVSLAALVAVAVLGAAAASDSSTDWPNWRGPSYNGISAETGWVKAWTDEKATRLWRASVGIGFSSIAVAGGRAYTMGNAAGKDTVYCFDAASGEVVWRYSYPSRKGAKNYEGGTHCTPTIDGTNVYTISKWGDAFCFDAAKGTVKWKRNLAKELRTPPPTWGFATSPRVLDNMLILNAGTAGVALNKSTGRRIWVTGTGKSGYSTPVIFQAGAATSMLMFGEKALIAVSAKNGKELWRVPWQTRYDVNAADPIVDGDRIFISSGYNTGCALLKVESGRPRKLWTNRKMRNHFNSCVLWKQHIYGFDETTLRCLSIADGTEKWNRTGLGKGSLMLADEKLIILSDRGKLVIAKAQAMGFEQLASKQILTGKCWTVPVLSGGKIYARSAPGEVVCYGEK